MAGDMFGAPIGVSQAEQDMARTALSEAQVKHMAVQDAVAPAQAQAHIASAMLATARSVKLQGEADTQARIAAAALQDPMTETDKRNPAWKLANIAMRLGSPDLAVKYADKASSIDQRSAAVDTNEARKALIQTRARLAQIDELSRNVRAVNSPEALLSAIQAHEQATGEQTGLLDQNGRLIPQAAENWEAVRDEIQERSLTEKDRIAADYRERALKSADQERKSKQDNRSFWQDFGNQEKRADAQRRGRGVKAGVDIFSKVEGAKLGADYLNTQFTNLMPEQARFEGKKLADRALQLRQKNPALTPNEAIQQAFKELDSSGAYGNLNRRPVRANVPQPLPADRDPSKLKVGQVYKDDKGRTMEWGGLGVGWKKPSSSLMDRLDDLLEGRGGKSKPVSGKIGGVSAGFDGDGGDGENLENDENDLED